MKYSLIIRISAILSVLLLPFGVFYWINPLTGNLSIGNDYVTFSIDHQLALQYSMKHGSFPLYAPGFAGGGHSAAALTLGQAFHPISHIASHLPGYWTGQALQVNTALRLAFIGLTHLALLILLRRLKLKIPIAFILSFITVYNLRMLDMFRYGASLENYLAFLLLCAALSFDYLNPSRILGPTFIVIATYLLICGGHPQIMYLGLLGSGIIASILPFALSAVLPEAKPDKARLKKFYLRTAIFVSVGIAMSCAYILPFYLEFIRGNASRVARDYSWSLGYSDSWGGVLNSFFRPLNADVHGTFGSSSLIVLILIVPIAAFLLKRAPKILFVLFGLALVVFLISLGRATPLHYLFWRFVPLADSFRTPGRINLILPFLFLLLLAWLLKNGVSHSFQSRRLERLSPLFAAVVLGIVLYVVYNVWLIHIVPKPSHYTPITINRHPFLAQQVAYWVGLASLILFAAYALFTKSRIASAVIGILLCISVVLQCSIQLRYGTWVTPVREKPTLVEIDRKMRTKLAVLGLSGFGMESPPVAGQMKKSALDTKTAEFYRTYKTALSPEEAYDYIASRRRADEAAAVSSRASKPKARCADAAKECAADTIEMTSASYNRTIFKVTAAEDGLFTVSYPFFSNWRAFVDGKPETPVRANGYLIGVFVQQGTHQVEVRFAGTASLIGFSCFACAVLGMAIYFSFAFRARLKKAAVIGLGATIGLGVFVLQYQSLYTGDNLMTRYHWTSKELPLRDNLAYGKKTEMSSIKSVERPYEFYAGRAVDGEGSTSFLTSLGGMHPWWQIDLGAEHTLNEIVLYESSASSIKQHLPLKIMLSSNGKQFREAAVLNERPADKPWHISLNSETSRHIRIASSGSGGFSLREVEVFGDVR